jgi:hypothetical protein
VLICTPWEVVNLDYKTFSTWSRCYLAAARPACSRTSTLWASAEPGQIHKQSQSREGEEKCEGKHNTVVLVLGIIWLLTFIYSLKLFVMEEPIRVWELYVYGTMVGGISGVSGRLRSLI